MMDFIIQLVSMSLQASLIIGVVLLLRLLFMKLNISKKYVMLLWIIPFFCLIFPWKVSSPVGFWDSAPSEYGYESLASSDKAEESQNNRVIDNSSDEGTMVGSDINSIVGNEGSDHTNTDEVISGGQNSNNDVTSGDVASGPNAGEVKEKDNVNTVTDGNSKENMAAISLEQVIMIVTITWGIGVIGLALYSILTFGRLKKQLGKRIPMRDNIFLADDIPVPMVVGFIKPEIYIPSGIDESHLEYVIAHEQTHIRRKDTIVKVVAYCITCIHWFNPFVWLAYNLLVKDMEMACDEETILRLGQDKKKDYATALLQLSTGKRNVFAVPLAFGEGNTKARIVNVLKYKKTKQIFAVAALIIGILLAIVFLTKDGSTSPEGTESTEGMENSEQIDNTEDTDGTDDSGTTVTEDEPEKYLTLTFNDVYQAVFAGNVGELRFRNCENGRRVSDSGSEADFYYFFDLEYQGKEYVLKTYYDGIELSLTKVTLHKPTGGRIILYPLQDYGNGSYSLIQKWKPLEDRIEKFCYFLGLDKSVYKTDWELELEQCGLAEYGIWIKYVLMEKGADLSLWYQDYDGSNVQVVSRGAESAGAGVRQEIVYYQEKENESVETALEHMLNAMMEPLTQPSDDRPYTIIRYDFEEQPLIQISENIWLLENIKGYYEYEGKDLGSMEDVLKHDPDCQREDGLIPFMLQGSGGNLVYFLIKEDGVYRLQIAGEMVTSEYDAVKEIIAANSLSQEKLDWFETSFFNDEENRVPIQFLTSEYASPEEIDFYELFYNGIYDGNRPEISQEELDFLKQRYNAMTELDVSKMTKEDIDSLLKQYMDISLEETEKIGLDKLYYLEEYNAYYTTVGDTNMRNIDILSGWNNEDGTITIRYSPMNGNSPTDEVYEVTLKNGNESYCFLFNVKVDE